MDPTAETLLDLGRHLARSRGISPMLGSSHVGMDAALARARVALDWYHHVQTHPRLAVVAIVEGWTIVEVGRELY